jgi:hypothetical protein
VSFLNRCRREELREMPICACNRGWHCRASCALAIEIGFD